MTSEGAVGTVNPNGVGAKGAFNKSVLDIIFPDIAAADGTIANTNGAIATHDDGADFCTLNFRVPLQAVAINHRNDLIKFLIYIMVLFNLQMKVMFLNLVLLQRLMPRLRSCLQFRQMLMN